MIKNEILKEIAIAEIRIIQMYKLLDKTKDTLPSVKKCPTCGTLNYHYYAETNNWCCACC